jgi:hypothetical protein
MITLNTLVDEFGFLSLVEGIDLNREITSLNCCDLLSWVMANGKENEAWITVMTHTNILAVTSLLDMACVIIPEGIAVETATIDKAKEKGIAIFSTSDNAFKIFTKFYEKGLRV